MRLILEKDEIVAILGKHFDTELDPTKVIIRTDPFEIEVCGLPLGSGEAPPPPPTRREDNLVTLPQSAKRAPPEETPRPSRDDEDATTEDPEPGTDGISGEAASIHPAAVLAASKALEQELDRENPRIARRAGKWSHIAPTSSEGEIE